MSAALRGNDELRNNSTRRGEKRRSASALPSAKIILSFVSTLFLNVCLNGRVDCTDVELQGKVKEINKRAQLFGSRQNPFGSLETRMAPSSFTPLQVAHVRWIDASPTGQREFTVGRPLTHDARKLSQNAAGNE